VQISPEVLDSAGDRPGFPGLGRHLETIVSSGHLRSGQRGPAALARPDQHRLSPQEREKAAILAGFIAVDADDASRAAFADEIAALRALAMDGLSTASSDSMFVYLQQAVLGFDGDEVWGKELDHINDGEVDVQCPECEKELLVELNPEDGTVEPGRRAAQRRERACIRSERQQRWGRPRTTAG
jgi:hypothetical protein